MQFGLLADLVQVPLVEEEGVRQAPAMCKVPDKAVIKLSAQNGMTYNAEPAVANGCGAKKAKKSSLLRRFRAGW